MTAQTQVYLFNIRQTVVLLEIGASATRRYEKMYAKDLTINRGVDNLIQFAFINQEQKPVNITGKEITCRILNYNGTEILLQKSLTPILAATGITSLQLSAEDIQDIPPQSCFYSLEIPVGEFDYPVFVDENGGARGVMNIVDSVLPSFVPANNVTIPSHLRPQIGINRTYYSSVIKTKESPIISIQYWISNFTGNIQIQGSTLADFSTFYDITSIHSYSAETANILETFEGYHPYIRMKIENAGTLPADTDGYLLGDVDQILSR